MAARLSAAQGPYTLNQNSEINVTPFVDIMLVLLIIFMLAIPASTVSHNVDLPPVASSTQPPSPPIIVSLDAEGRLFLGHNATSLASLPADLKLVTGGASPEQQRIEIRADGKIRYEVFMQVMNQLQSSGYHKVALVGEEL
ncbi:MAG TPA: biopolymer transporter ExbD [Phenylobacterium sp.]